METACSARCSRAASPQRGSWRSQRRGSVASPVMIGSNRKCAGNHPLSAGSPRQGATHRLDRCIVAPFILKGLECSGLLANRESSWPGQAQPPVDEIESFSSSITWSSVSSPGQIRKLSSIPPRVQRRWVRALRVSSGIRCSSILLLMLVIPEFLFGLLLFGFSCGPAFHS